MGVDPKARKQCKCCGRWMLPHYNPNRGHYESEHWERKGAWKERRFCSGSCANSVHPGRRAHAANRQRNAKIMRLRRLGRTHDQIMAELGLKRGIVDGVIFRHDLVLRRKRARAAAREAHADAR